MMAVVRPSVVVEREAPRPHDLLWTTGALDALRSPSPLPGWVDAAWLSSAPLVVRREQTSPGLVPVGLRGMQRHQRHAAYLPTSAITRRTPPEILARTRAWEPWGDAAGHVCRRALRTLAPLLDELPWPWGITGGAGFAIATGLPVLRETSDLDLLLRIPHAPDPAILQRLSRRFDELPLRVDVQIDIGHGGFALAEWLRGGLVMLKTRHGPRLVADPWSAAAP
ncbi:malonate decarboxylase holo-ACP synthase [Dyella sp. 2RAB6]|uniref:malonate decarboxylase holo-ACP synthase n=1 Tax=Dyella sp. 2RAB6 TaxID=3232992 RepID=UPI003F915CAA